MAKRNSTGSSGNRRRGASANSKASHSVRGKSSDKPFKKNTDRTEKSATRAKSSERYADKSDQRNSKKPYPARNKEKAQPFSENRKSSGGDKKSFGKGDFRKSFSKGSGSESSFEREGRKLNKTDASQKPYAKRDDGSKPARYSKSYSSSPKKFSDRSGSTRQRNPRPNDSEDFSTTDGQEKSFSSKPYSTRKPSKSRLEEKITADPDKIRLNRYIANSGLCSRREADEFITMGLVTVNGQVVTELGYKVNRTDQVRYEDKVLRAEKPVYILMNKPKGYLTTTKDPQERNTVMHILGNTVKERVYPVGRLDRNTTGLLLLTNDGELADKLMHPSYNVKKIYKVELDKPITKADFKKIKEGVYLEEGKAVVDDLAVISDDNKTIGIELHIGWNRVVRRIFESLQYDVVKLDRSVYAGLDKKDLPRGHWRFLKKEEVILLKHYK